MSPLVIEVLLILLLVVANGVLALSEIAVVSSRRVRLQQRAINGDAGARVALELAADPTRFLATVQIGITLVGIFAGAFGGATIAEHLAEGLSRLPALAPLAEALSLGMVVLTITYLTLVIGELLPKHIALSRPERFASIMARPMRLLSKLAAPAVHILSVSTKGLLRLLGIQFTPEPPVTTEELIALLALGESAGVFDPTEQGIVENALHLDELRVSALITPRTEIIWLDLDTSLQNLQTTIIKSPHSYFPAAHGNLDNVVGVVRGRDVLAQQVLGQPLDLTALMNQPWFVPESQPASRMLDLFKRSGLHVILVIDEYGGVQGLVTLTDIMEALVGNIRAPGMPDEPMAVRREDGSWLLDGRLSVRELRGLLGLRELPGEGAMGVDTLGGLVMATLSRIPSKGDDFEYAKWRFEVVDMDGKRVDQVLVTPLPPQAPPDAI